MFESDSPLLFAQPVENFSFDHVHCQRFYPKSRAVRGRTVISVLRLPGLLFRFVITWAPKRIYRLSIDNVHLLTSFHVVY